MDVITNKKISETDSTSSSDGSQEYVVDTAIKVVCFV